MRRYLFLIIALLLLFTACQPQPPIIITATPAPPTETPEPSPTTCVQFENHCNWYFQALNPNNTYDDPYLTWDASRTSFGVPNSPEVIRHTVQVPAPQEVNTWLMELTGLHGSVSVPGWIPNVFCKSGYCEANLTSVSGKFMSTVEWFEFQADTNYLLKLVYRPRLRTVDSQVSYSASKGFFRELCRLDLDNGLRRFSAVQSLRDDRVTWNDDLEEEIVVSVGVRRNVSARVSCGFDLLYPAFDGQVQIDEFTIMTVDWNDSDMQLFIP